MKAAGKRLWKKITDSYDLDERESEVLTLACATADDVADLAALVADGGSVSARAELRMTRAALSRLLGQIRLPVEDGSSRTQQQLRASKAAQVRWSKTAEAREERKRAGGSTPR
jgi:hypothetical protein